jgi:hypothetical protein
MLLFGLIVGLADLLGHSPAYLPLAALTVTAAFAARFLTVFAWRRALYATLLLSILVGLLAVVQTPWFWRPRGPFVSPNFLGHYAVAHVFIAFYLRATARRFGRRVCDLSLAFNLLATLLSQSRASFAALAAGLLLVVAMTRPKYLLELVAAGAVAFLYVNHLHAGQGADPRIGIWLQGLRLAHFRLLLGYGQRDFLIMPGYLHFYNVALECLVAAGILGLAAAVWMMIAGWRTAWRLPLKQERIALCAFLLAWIVNSMFIYATPETVAPLYAVLALLVNRDVANRAALVHDRQPLMDDALSAVNAGRADRGDRNRAVRHEA